MLLQLLPSLNGQKNGILEEYLNIKFNLFIFVFVCRYISSRSEHDTFTFSLAMCYLLSKFLMVTNSITLLCMVNSFLGSQSGVYGVDVFNSLYTGVGVERHGTDNPFPRNVMCDFTVTYDYVTTVANKKFQNIVPPYFSRNMLHIHIVAPYGKL